MSRRSYSTIDKAEEKSITKIAISNYQIIESGIGIVITCGCAPNSSKRGPNAKPPPSPSKPPIVAATRPAVALTASLNALNPTLWAQT